MKRQQERDSPATNSKIPRSNMSRFDDGARDRLTPDRDRREGRSLMKSPNHRAGGFTQRQHGGKNREERGLLRTPHDSGRDLRDDFVRNRSFDKSLQYKVLCVSNINHKVTDALVKDVLVREFKKFGEVSNIKVTHEGNERVALVYFRNADDAREAKINKNRAVLFDKPVNVDPVYPDSGGGGDRRSRKSYSPDNNVLSYSRPRGVSPAVSNSSGSSLNRRGRNASLERSALPPHPRDAQFRRDGPGPHHDFHQNLHRDESKKEKFPNYLLHIPPEEDDKATRTLFVGNLEVNIQESELRRIFERYGVVEDIDVKRPPPGQGNAYAFIKFANLDMAHRAKVEMSGQYIGKFQCKIGYGKATPTTRIWVGGLGPWTSLSHLEREFDRFGAIKKIDFVKGENHAYILYDSIDAAQAACQEMRGFPLGGPDRRLRVDFADTTPYNSFRQPSPRTNFRDDNNDRFVHPRRFDHDQLSGGRSDYFAGQDTEFSQWPSNSSYLNQQYEPYYERGGRTGNQREWTNFNERDHRGGNDFRGNWDRDRNTWRNDGNRDWSERRKRPRSPDSGRDGPRLDRNKDGGFKHLRASRTPDCLPDDRTSRGRRSPSPFHEPGHRNAREHDLVGNKDRRYSFNEFPADGEKGDRDRTRGNPDDFREDRSRGGDGPASESRNGFSAIHSATTLQDIARSFPMAWHGGLVLKNSAFPTRMHKCDGDTVIVDAMMKYGSGETPMLRITQRLRLDQPKLDDVSKRIASSGPMGHCILIGLPGSVQTPEELAARTQQRPLRNLVSYLKQKEAAGVIALPVNKEAQETKDPSGVLYAFPPCPFSHDLLKRIAPNLTEEGLKDDHLLVVVVKGAI